MISAQAVTTDLDDLPPRLRFLAGGGEATRLILNRDWSGHWLGSPETWPEALKVSLSLVLNSPESMILCWGREELAFFFNETYFPLLGPRLPWATGEAMKVVWADGWDQAGPIIDEAFAGQARRFVDLPWKLGTDRGSRDTWWSFSYSRVLDADGEIAGLFIFTNETTARVLADVAAKESQERLRGETERQRLSLQQMPGFAALLSGPEHRFDYVNDAYREISGERDFIGRTVREVFPELEGQGFYELLDGVYATGEPFVAHAMPVSFGRPDGERYIDFIYQPLRDDNGSVAGIFVGGYDITDRVRAEKWREALIRLDARLHDVADTAELSFAASEILGKSLGAARVGYGVFDGQERTITIERNWSAPGFGSVAGLHHFKDFGSYIEELLRGQAVRNSNVDTDPRTAANAASFHALGVRAHLDVPVVEDGRAVAQIFVHSAHPRIWKNEEVELVRDFAERTRIAIERRQAERRLAGSEERYRQIVEGAEDFAIVTLDEAGLITGWNSGAERLTGFKVDDALGQSGSIFFTPEDREHGVPEHEMDRAASEKRAVDERWHQRADGSRFWGSGLMMRLAGSGYLKMFRDRTAEHEAEMRARESEEQFRVFAQAMPNHVWASRPDGNLYWFNDQVYAYSGEEPGSLDGTDWARILHPGDLAEAASAWTNALAIGDIYETEFRIRRADGAYRWFLVRAEPVRDVEGSIVNWIGTNTDIEDRKRQAAELVAFNATLEQQVQERTGELMAAEEALRQSQKMDAMGQLTGGVAHDFNNLLTPIVGALDMLQRRGVGGEREQRLIAGAAQSAERARVLVQRLLAFARRQPLQPVAVDVAQLVRGMADLVSSTTGPQIKVVVDVADDLSPARADPNQLEMAMLNLAVNARDAMPDGGTLRISASADTVRARTNAGLRPGRYIRLSVADTGVGMDEATLARAVEPFFSTKGVGKGTGLGLSMVHGLASQLGGALTIKSEPGLGTNIELWLPQTKEALEAPAAASDAELIDVRGTVLLVDDEEFVRLSTADMLGDLGYRVVEAVSAEEALRVIRNGIEVDLVVTDHLMPGMTGTDLARNIRDHRPGMPVLIVSGYAEVDGIAPNMPRLTKPFRKDELATSLATLFSSRVA